jgi:hypothetical protein
MISASPLRKHAGFRWLFAGQTISVIGSQFSALALPVLAVTVLGASEWQMGFLTAADSSAFLLFGLIAGAWVDRWLKRKVMIVADLVRGFALLVLPVLWLMGLLQFWQLLLVGAIVSVATVFFDVGYQSFIPILVAKDQIGSANSVLETSGQISHVAGPGLVGLLLTILKAPWLILADAASFFVSAFTLFKLRDDEVQKSIESRRPLRTEIAEGLHFVWRQPLIRAISFTTATSNLFSTITFTLFPLLMLRDLGVSPASLGIVFSIASVGGLLGATATAKLIKVIGEGTLISLSAVVMGLAGLLVPVAAMLPQMSALILIGISQFITSFTTLSYNITQVTARQRLCPPELLGRMNASIRFFVWGVMPIGALLAGWLGSVLGIQITLWIAATAALLSASFVVFSPLTRLQVMPDIAE